MNKVESVVYVRTLFGDVRCNRFECLRRPEQFEQ